MNPNNDEFKNRTASSPAIFNRCVIDWFGDWSDGALFEVAEKLLRIREDQKKQVVSSMVIIHQSIREINQELKKQA